MAAVLIIIQVLFDPLWSRDRKIENKPGRDLRRNHSCPKENNYAKKNLSLATVLCHYSLMPQLRTSTARDSKLFNEKCGCQASKPIMVGSKMPQAAGKRALQIIQLTVAYSGGNHGEMLTRCTHGIIPVSRL